MDADLKRIKTGFYLGKRQSGKCNRTTKIQMIPHIGKFSVQGNLRPTGLHFIAAPIEPPSRSNGGIFLPPAHLQYAGDICLWRVLSVGSQVTEFKPGESVYLKRDETSQSFDDGTGRIRARADKVLAVITSEE